MISESTEDVRNRGLCRRRVFLSPSLAEAAAQSVSAEYRILL